MHNIKFSFIRSCTLAMFSLLLPFSSMYAQTVPSIEKTESNEYMMSHVEVDAGGLTGLVLPQRIAMLPKKSYKWVAAENGKVSVVEKTETSASIRANKSGTTVVNYVYKYEIKGEDKPVMKDGKQVVKDGVPQTKAQMIQKEGTYPFTIKVNRLDAESITTPSVIRIGWDVVTNMENYVTYYPKYSEANVGISIDDVDIAECLSGNKVKGTKLGTTRIHFSTPDGLKSESSLEVIIPTLKTVSINQSEKILVVGDEVQLTYSFSPARSTPIVSWNSSNPAVIEISNEGYMKAIATGKATITITSDNGVKDSIEIKVKKK